MSLLARLVLVVSLAVAGLLVPRVATADTTAIAEKHVPERKPGVQLSLGFASGLVLFRRGFVPTSRVSYMVGGVLTDRFSLGAELSGAFHFGRPKSAFVGDIVATTLLSRRLMLRTAVGVTTNAPIRIEKETTPGAGGLVGLAYEFPLFKHGGLAVGIDYDARVRADGHAAQTVLFGLRFAGRPPKKW